MMKRRDLFWVAVAGLVLCAGCAVIPSVRRNEEISRRIRKDMIDFYENMAQAYWLLGFSYFELHKEALANNNKEAGEQYLKHAAAYKTYAEELRKSLEVWRKSLGMPASESQPLLTEGQAVPAPKPAAPGPPEVVSPAPAKGKPSLLGRLRPWGRRSPSEPAQQKPSILDRIRFGRRGR